VVSLLSRGVCCKEEDGPGAPGGSLFHPPVPLGFETRLTEGSFPLFSFLQRHTRERYEVKRRGETGEERGS